MEDEKKQQNSTDTKIGYNTVLAVGICGTCNVPKIINTGDGVSEPLNPELYCEKMKTFIEPEPPEYRRMECEFYACR